MLTVRPKTPTRTSNRISLISLVSPHVSGTGCSLPLIQMPGMGPSGAKTRTPMRLRIRITDVIFTSFITKTRTSKLSGYIIRITFYSRFSRLARCVIKEVLHTAVLGFLTIQAVEPYHQPRHRVANRLVKLLTSSTYALIGFARSSHHRAGRSILGVR